MKHRKNNKGTAIITHPVASGLETRQKHYIKCRRKFAPLLISCRSNKSPKQNLHNNVINNTAVTCSQESRANLRLKRQWENRSSSETLTGLPTNPINHSSYGCLPQQECEPHTEQVIKQVPSILSYYVFVCSFWRKCSEFQFVEMITVIQYLFRS